MLSPRPILEHRDLARRPGRRRPRRPHPHRGDGRRPRRRDPRAGPHRTRGAAAVRRGRPGPGRPDRARGDRDVARGRGPRRAPRLAARPEHGRLLPELGDAAARAAQPAQRHRRQAAGRPAPARPPGHRRAPPGRCSVVVAPVRSVLQPQVKGLGDLEPVDLRAGDTAPLEDVVRRLADAAYSRVDLVEKRGEFAVRGGIVDVFPPTEEHPLRVEFWGDDVEEIRSFSVADQRTHEKVERLWAPPCRELLLTDEVRERAPRRWVSSTRSWSSSPTRSRPASRPRAWRRSRRCSSTTWSCSSTCSPTDTHVLVLDPERARRRAHDLVATSEEFLGASWAAAAGGGSAPIDLGAASYRELGDVREHAVASGKAWWSVSPFGIADDGRPAGDRRAGQRRPGRCADPVAADAGRRPLPRRRREGVRRPREVAWRRATARSWCTPATGRRSARSRRWGSGTSRPGWSTRLERGARPPTS